MKKFFLFFSMLITSLYCNALDVQVYRELLDAIEHGNELVVIKLKNTYELSTSEKEKLSAFAKEIVLDWKQIILRANSFSYHAIPESIKKQITPDYVQKFAGWLSVISLLAYAPTIFTISVSPYNWDTKKGLAAIFCVWNTIISTSGVITWVVRNNKELDAYKKAVTEGYNTARRIQVLIES